MNKQKRVEVAKESKAGYTLVEVVLVLAIAGLMLIGLIGSSYTAIARQRYNDSVRGIAEFIKSTYDEALSPESFGEEGFIGNDNNRAILGKAIEFNSDGSIYTATIIGNATVKKSSNQGFIEEFTEQDPGAPGSTATNAAFYCGNIVVGNQTSIKDYTPLWGAELLPAKALKDSASSMGKNTASSDGKLIGTMVIARTPSSGTLHTMFAPGRVYGINDPDHCQMASQEFRNDLKLQNEHLEGGGSTFKTFEMTTVGICIKSDNSRLRREIRIAKDGRNSSAVWTRNVDTNEGEEEQCNE